MEHLLGFLPKWWAYNIQLLIIPAKDVFPSVILTQSYAEQQSYRLLNIKALPFRE